MTTNNDSSALKVETAGRLARWRYHNFSHCTSRISHPFKIGMWNWRLVVASDDRILHVKLYPELSEDTDSPPVASFIIRLLSSGINSKALAQKEVKDKLSNRDGYTFVIKASMPNKFIIDIEFLDLKIRCPKDGALYSIWPRSLQQRLNSASNECLGRMLTENINTDITIYENTSNASIRAHRAVLAARSPVFRAMFSHNLKENDLSIINITDMSFEACQALVNYLYGIIKYDEFLTNRLALLRAADKYDISDLREACHESLMEDIDTTNVLEILQCASLHQLPNLKRSCIQYLVKFGKIRDIHDDFMKAFIADTDLISEVFYEVMNELKGF